MSKETRNKVTRLGWLAALTVVLPGVSLAQVPVDENGDPIPVAEAEGEQIPLLGPAELEELVGPIALYPDDLLAIVLPATTYPLQLVQADRFLEDLKNDSSLEPDEAWDDSIIALLNYPEAIELLTDELDQTWRLGEAVVAQQADVVAAIESFRDKAYAAGNLKSDTHQTVSQNDGVIEITPVEEDVIYVPYYEPERVVVYQPSPVYYYYPRAYPVYYYPYPYGHSFARGFFWGVTTAFTVGWFTDSLHVYHHSYYGHPYYGRYYGHHYWYRRPSIHVHNNYYYNSHHNYYSGNRYTHGDYWRPHSGSTVGHYDQRVTRSRHYSGSRAKNGHHGGYSEERRSKPSRHIASANSDIKFRQRSSTTSNQASSLQPRRESSARPAVTFRERPESTNKLVASNRTSTQRNSRIDRGVETPRSNRPANSSQRARTSQPTRSNESRSSGRSSAGSSQPPRLSQPSRSSEPSRSSRPSRSSSPARASRPARSSQPSGGGKPPKTVASNSVSKKSAGPSSGNRNRGSSRRR